MDSAIDNILQNGYNYLKQMKEYEYNQYSNILNEEFDINFYNDLCKNPLEENELYLYKIDELIFSKNEGPRRESMENILSSFRNLQDINLIYLILGDKLKVSFYIGVAANLYNKDDNLDLKSWADDILKPTLKGNFVGSSISEVDRDEKKDILNKIRNNKHSGFINGIPGFINENSGEKNDFQGVERLVDTMIGSNFGFMVIANPCKNIDIFKVNQDIYQLYDSLLPISKYSLQKSESDQTQSGTDENDSTTTNVTLGTNRDSSESVSESDANVTDNRNDVNNQKNNSKHESKGDQKSTTIINGVSNSESSTISTTENKDNKTLNGSESANKDRSNSSQYNKSESLNISTQYSNTITESVSNSKSNSFNKSKSNHESTSKSINVNNSSSTNRRSSNSNSRSLQYTHSLEVEQKIVINWLKYIDEELLARVDNAKGKGAYTTCSYLFSDNGRATLYRVANTILGLYGGEKGNISPLQFTEFTQDNLKNLDPLKGILENLQVPLLTNKNEAWKSIFSKINIQNGKNASFGTWLNSDELGILMGMPRKEILGVSSRNAVEYGVNISSPTENEINNSILLGNLVHLGEQRENNIYLNKESLKTHTFICGVTGTGKTTTCQSILLNSKLPFLVIEPAKTEYRALTRELDDVYYFTLGKQDLSPFFLNPFEIFEGESITSRVDMIKATMQSSFDMEAAMPQIIEAAAYDVYKKKGWNIKNSQWINPATNKLENPFVADSFAFPTLNDFIESIESVTKEQGFGDKMEAEYLGSLKARLQALLVGAKGMMLNTPRSVDFKKLVTQKVVIELEEIKDGAEKSLIMGFIITNLLEAVKYQFNIDNKFQHITLVEEAHRLLSRYEPGDSPNKKRGVEVFADMLAEVRKYGESLIIVDQIPNKMTPEVLKNTNTKIVHKIFAQDDKEAIGNTMALNDDQKGYMSYLDRGRAIVITEGWKKPALVQIKQYSYTTGKEEISTDIIKSKSIKYYQNNYENGVLPNISSFNKNISEKDIKNYFMFSEDLVFNDLTIIRELFYALNNKGNDTPLERKYSIEEIRENIIRDLVNNSRVIREYINAGLLDNYIKYLLGRLSVRINSKEEDIIKDIIMVIYNIISKSNISYYTSLGGKNKHELDEAVKEIINEC